MKTHLSRQPHCAKFRYFLESLISTLSPRKPADDADDICITNMQKCFKHRQMCEFFPRSHTNVYEFHIHIYLLLKCCVKANISRITELCVVTQEEQASQRCCSCLVILWCDQGHFKVRQPQHWCLKQKSRHLSTDYMN